MLIQRFRRPHDPVSPAAAELIDSPVLLIHPALDTYIRRQRINKDFIQFQHIRVGEKLVWQPYAHQFARALAFSRCPYRPPSAVNVDLFWSPACTRRLDKLRIRCRR